MLNLDMRVVKDQYKVIADYWELEETKVYVYSLYVIVYQYFRVISKLFVCDIEN